MGSFENIIEGTGYLKMEDTSMFQGQEINLCNESLKMVDRENGYQNKTSGNRKVESPTQMGKLASDINPL